MDLAAPATLLLFHNGIGDYVMALPALRALCAHAPRPLVFVVGTGAHRFLLDELNPDALIEVRFEQRWPAKDFDAAAVLEHCRRCDTLVSLCTYACDGQTRLLQALRPARRIGFVAGFDERIDADAPPHEIDRLFALAGRALPAPVAIDAFLAPPCWPAADTAAVAAMRRAFGPQQRVLVLHNETRPDKVYPAERLDRLAAGWLADDPSLNALVLAQGADAWPHTAASGRAAFLRGMTLERGMAVAADADVFVGIDSCMLHVADFAQRRALGLFGPTDPRRAGFRITPAPAAVALHSGGPLGQFDDALVDAAARRALQSLRADAQTAS